MGQRIVRLGCYAVLAVAVAGLAVAATADTGWLGVTLGRSDSSDGEGVLLQGIFVGSPADKAGLRARDVIVAVDGTPVKTRSELIAQIQGKDPGSWIPLSIVRGDEERDVRVRLDSRPEHVGAGSVRRGWIGVKAIDLPPNLREHFGAPPAAGAMVADIVPGSSGEVAGFELGDVVFEMNGDPIRTAQDLALKVGGAGVGNRVEFTLMRSGVEVVLEALVNTEPIPER